MYLCMAVHVCVSVVEGSLQQEWNCGSCGLIIHKSQQLGSPGIQGPVTGQTGGIHIVDVDMYFPQRVLHSD